MNQPPALSASELYLLLALSTDVGYGYNLRARCADLSLGSVRLAAGTIYPLLERLHDYGFIDMLGLKPAGKSGKPRMFYGISENGTLRLKEDLVRLKHVVKVAELNGLLQDEVPLDIQKLMLEGSIASQSVPSQR